MFRRKILLVITVIVMVLLFPTAALAQAPQLTIYAGLGEPGYQDGERTEASFFAPFGLAQDNSGNLIIADSYNNMIRTISSQKMVTTVTGSIESRDSFGFPQGGLIDGDNARARLMRPRGLAINSKGDLFVADTNNHVIRKITGGKTLTFAGTGKAGFANGTSRQALFNSPSDIAIDKDDNIYVADTLNNAIRKITPQGQVSVYAGSAEGTQGFKDGANAEALFNEPSALDIDQKGALYVLDCGNQLLRKIDQGKVETSAGVREALITGTQYHEGGYGDGPNLEASFNFPKGIDVTDSDIIFIADTWNHRVRALIPGGRVITIAGTGTSGKKAGSIYSAQLGSPVDILYSDKALYITDMENHLIWKMELDPANIFEIPEFNNSDKEIQVFINGEKIPYPKEQTPYIINGKTMIPLRLVSEKLGAVVDYKKKSVSVAKGSMQKELTYNKDTLVLNKDTTMVHLRYLAENLGFNVDWVPDFRAVVIRNR